MYIAIKASLKKYLKKVSNRNELVAVSLLLFFVATLISCTNISDQKKKYSITYNQAGDFDSDGVYDDVDKCIGSFITGSVDSEGCPLDSDGDGTPDFIDMCPNTENGKVANFSGCVVGSRTTFQDTISGFDFGSSYLTTAIKGRLNKLMELVGPLDEGDEVFIFGYADSRGGAEFNQFLSDRRAKNVTDYLTSVGVDDDKVTFRGYGATNFVGLSTDEESESLNRRVEILINLLDSKYFE